MQEELHEVRDMDQPLSIIAFPRSKRSGWLAQWNKWFFELYTDMNSRMKSMFIGPKSTDALECLGIDDQQTEEIILFSSQPETKFIGNTVVKRPCNGCYSGKLLKLGFYLKTELVNQDNNFYNPSMIKVSLCLHCSVCTVNSNTSYFGYVTQQLLDKIDLQKRQQQNYKRRPKSTIISELKEQSAVKWQNERTTGEKCAITTAFIADTVLQTRIPEKQKDFELVIQALKSIEEITKQAIEALNKSGKWLTLATEYYHTKIAKDINPDKINYFMLLYEQLVKICHVMLRDQRDEAHRSGGNNTTALKITPNHTKRDDYTLRKYRYVLLFS
ncbi:hypothetical protein C0J52_20360 [Blattella germanica]|nr:hypothetical protein C0J52_20360 [Blattella germanica]